LPKIKQALRAISRGKKIATILLRKSSFVSKRRAQDADQKRNLLWFDGRGCVVSPRAGKKFRCPENGREPGFTALPCLPAGARWIMDAAAMPGDRLDSANAAQAIGAKRDRRELADQDPMK
jgi:hypothetical protein